LVTIKDVAKRAEVSVSTASRILSNSTTEKFSQDTHARVLRASLELGYRANFAARALVSGETRIIASVFPRIYDTPFTALASLQILSGIEAFCSEHGYHTLLSSPRILPDGTVDPSFLNMLASGYPDGIIIDSHFQIDPLMEVVEQFGIPTIALGYSQHPYRLQSDNFLGGELVMQHMVELGHRRIGIIGLSDGVSPAADQRLMGMRVITDAVGLDFDSMPRVNGNFSSESGGIAAIELITKHPDLTAILAINDRMAMGAILQLQAMGYPIPERMSVTGYDDLPRAGEFNPSITTINQQLSSWGELSMQMLLDLMANKQPEPMVVQPRLIVRKSTAPPLHFGEPLKNASPNFVNRSEQ
jgi:LacI family transcriptional regulator